MGTTALGIVYPDPAAVPARAAIQSLATTADAAIQTAVAGRLITGTVITGTGTANTVQSIAVTFPAGSFTAAPKFVGVNPVVQNPAIWQACAISLTATGFTLQLSRGAAATPSIPVTYTAIA